ncbi:MAG TPA: GNAT family N-acetyltransferase [Solirubrobacteraceae bacterium]|nr:GNAT family N-acetyltransferase [Solirubrobacteraceae bacterium]
MSSANVSIRPATARDVDFIFAMIVALATYERAPEAVLGTPELLRESLFGERPHAEAVIAELDGEPVGFAVFHGTFSTWHCRPGIWLEDFFVMPEHRRGGVGERLFRHVAAIAVARGCSRLNWTALDWNEPALSFYRKMNAEALDEWTNHRLSGDALLAVAAGAGEP